MTIKQVHVEILDKSAMWRRVGSTPDHPQTIRMNLTQASKMHKTNARAVDNNGNIVDIVQHDGK